VTIHGSLPLRHWLVAAVALAAVSGHGIGSPSPAAAQAGSCDPGLESNLADALRYRLRGDRCEGLYVEDVANTALSVVSLTESYEDYDPVGGGDLVLQWTPQSPLALRLRAQGLRPRLYYRMDSVRPPGTTSYRWPPDMLATLHARKDDIGVMGWMRQRVGEVERDVYVPLRIGQRRVPARSDRYQLGVLSGRALAEVYLSLAPVGASGRPGAFLQDGIALGFGSYPARRVIMVPISRPAVPGVYYVEVGATLMGGGSTTVELWLYHGG
jgi:hypothetical protein